MVWSIDKEIRGKFPVSDMANTGGVPNELFGAI